MDWLTAEFILQVLGWAVAGAGAVWTVWAKVLPGMVEARLRALEDKRQLEAQAESHEQALEETYVGALVQSAATGQSDLTRSNAMLIAHLIESAKTTQADLRKEIQSLRGIAIREEAHRALTNMELSRLVDSMRSLERSLELVRGLLMSLAQAHPVMRDSDEEDLGG